MVIVGMKLVYAVLFPTLCCYLLNELAPVAIDPFFFLKNVSSHIHGETWTAADNNSL